MKMIVRILDSYYETKMDEESFMGFIRSSLYDYVAENGELDAEHWLELIEESERIELTSFDEDAVIELGEEQIDDLVDELREEIEADQKEIDKEDMDEIDDPEEEDEEEE